jgi:dUTP pyrophosphatase
MQSPVTLRLRAIHPKFGTAFALPQRRTEQAAGFDLCAALDAAKVLAPGAREIIPCGFSMWMPPGYEAQIRPRSGLALHHGVTCANAPGTIDADYRGEVKVLLINLGQQPYCVEPGSRIAQMVLAQVLDVQFELVSELPDSERGTGGFGSTGTA